MASSFENKKVIIAGGSSGIDLATATLLAHRKALVTVTGRNAARLRNVQSSANLTTVTLDSSDRDRLDDFFKNHGKIGHLLIALSGVKGMGDFASLQLNDLRDAFEGKFWPQLNTLQAALPYMDKTGSITLITAMTSKAGFPGTSGLAAINGTLELMVPVLAKELQPLRINAVSPGVVDSAWWDFLPADAWQQAFQQYAAQTPVQRVGQPEDIAQAVLFLMENTFTNGTTIYCDGGLSL